MLQVCHVGSGALSGFLLEIIKELVCEGGVLGELVVEVLHALLPHGVLVGYVVHHGLALVLDVFYHNFLLDHPQFLLLHQTILNVLNLASDWV